MSTADKPEHDEHHARPAPPGEAFGLSPADAEAAAVRAALEAVGVQVTEPAYVAHAPLPDDEGAEAAAHRAFDVVLNACTCTDSAVLVHRRPGGRVESLEHRHFDPACAVVLGMAHPELRTTP